VYAVYTVKLSDYLGVIERGYTMYILHFPYFNKESKGSETYVNLQAYRVVYGIIAI
jgi:hypothetical protein